MEHPVELIQAHCLSTGADLASVLKAVGVSRATWFRWKGGKFSPRFGTLERVKAAISDMERAA